LVITENVDGHGEIRVGQDAEGKDDALGGGVTLGGRADGGALAATLDEVVRLWRRRRGYGRGGGDMLAVMPVGMVVGVRATGVGGLPCLP